MTALLRIFKHVWLALVLIPLSASADTVRIYVTNSAGDSVHVIDPATNKVVQVFKDGGAHGIAFSPDGARVYVSNECRHDLDVFDRKSGKLIKQVPRATGRTTSRSPRTAASSSASPAATARSTSSIRRP